MRNVLTGGITPGREDLSKALNSVRAHVAQLGSPQTKITHVVLLTLKDYYFSLFFLSHIRRHRLRRQTITTTKDASYVLWSSESPSLLGLLARGQSILSPSFCLFVFFFFFAFVVTAARETNRRQRSSSSRVLPFLPPFLPRGRARQQTRRHQTRSAVSYKTNSDTRSPRAGGAAARRGTAIIIAGDELDRIPSAHKNKTHK